MGGREICEDGMVWRGDSVTPLTQSLFCKEWGIRERVILETVM